MDLMKLVMWLSLILMCVGFLGYAFALPIFFDSIGMFMLGGAMHVVSGAIAHSSC
jgi:hypothetical protein